MRSPWIIAALCLAACNRAAPDPGGSAPTPAAEPAAFTQARSAVLAQLRDPESARFAGFHSGRRSAVCGTVNARNGFGGFTGPEPFAWSPSAGVVLYEFQGEEGEWRERGEVAEQFAALGCSIGPDQAKALAALAALRDSDRRIAAD